LLCKVVLDYPASPPDFPGCGGLVSSRIVGHKRELIFVGYQEAQKRFVESLSPAPKSIEVVEMNLEDAFIEYTRGERRPLPVFNGHVTVHPAAVAPSAVPQPSNER
jgi:ABC-2 type transport system ATP-binding protein